jgi:hypothetical protein
VTALLLKAWPYLLAAAVAGFFVHHWDTARYAALQAAFSKYQAQVALADEASQKAASQALQAQLSAKTVTDARNEAVIEELQNEKSSLASSLTFANRLLAAAKAGATSGGSQVPAANGQPAAHGSTPASGYRPAPDLTQLVSLSATECADAIERFSALQAELAPQLKVSQ